MNYRKYISDIIHSPLYSNALISIIFINMLFLILESDASVSLVEQRGSPTFLFYRIMNLVFLSLYTMDTLLSIYVKGASYFTSGYNILDLFVVGIYWTDWISTMVLEFPSTVTALRFIRGLRTLRAFRIITHFRSLQVVVDAFLITMKTTVLDVLVLLLIVIFIFGILGYYLFGNSSKAKYSSYDWNTIGDAFYTLWVYVCADGY